MPTIIPNKGLLNSVNNILKFSVFERSATELLITFIPNISVAKPRRIVPVSLTLLFLENMSKEIPTKAITGAKVVGLQRVSRRDSPCMPCNERNQAVAVEPIFEPITVFIA